MLPTTFQQPLIMAGPCAAESFELMELVCEAMSKVTADLQCTYIFKASFDKANRTSIHSYRGPGLEKAMGWFQDLKKRYPGLLVMTDVHETGQISEVAETCDVLQIPAFLCRQTDLLVAAIETGRIVNVKKGQFVAPDAMNNVVEKAKQAAKDAKLDAVKILLTERGATFGYGNLVVDPRTFPLLAATQAPVIFDITHSTQLPQSADGGKQSGADRRFAPVLARAAAASGYLSGFFLEVHADPKVAKSDKEAQLTVQQGSTLLRQIVPLMRQAREFSLIDEQFRS